MTVLLLAYNEAEYVKLTIESFRRFGGEQLSLVLIDNDSTDGLRDWAATQLDITYVLLDEGHMGWGKAINRVREELQIDTDLLIMEAHYVLTPGYTQRVQELLNRSEETGGVGGIANGVCCHQNMPSYIMNYAEAAQQALKQQHVNGRQVLMLHHGAILLKKAVLDKLGPFEEALSDMQAVIKDYCLRMVMADIKLLVCPEALLWDIRSSGERIVQQKNFEQDGDLKILEDKWRMHYFNGDYNEALVQQIDAETNQEIQVLEIGCDCGANLVEIKNCYPCARVFGVEINERAAEVASHFAKVEVANIEEKKLPFEKESFDYIIIADVLEHLHNPLETLIYCKELLRKNGKIIINIPNVMHISVMEQLLDGDFTYEETGLLDKTHIHLFTYNEIIRMLQQAGYHICNVIRMGIPISDRQNELIDKLLATNSKAERFMYETFQYNVRVCRIEDKMDME